MLYGELGRFPIAITIKKRVISFWSKLLDKASKLSHRLYSVLYNNFNNDQYDFPLLQNVESILDEVGMNNIWTYQHPQNSTWLSKTIYQKLQDQYRQSGSAALNESPKCLNYRIIKTEHKFENYLIRMPPKMRKSFIDYRLCNNRLPIEIGRWAKLIEASESVTCVILVLLAMSFTMFWNVVSLTLIGKSFYHISKGNLLTALPMQMYLMILTLGD